MNVVILGALALLATPEAAGDLTLRAGADQKLFKALNAASEHLQRCGTCTVTIQVASGEQRGKANVGQWVLPETVAPGATLQLLGGYDSAFASRAPLVRPTVLVTSERRSGPVLEIAGRKTALKELTISGFAIDVGPGNRYDARTGQLHKGASSSWPILAFGALATERLMIADNIFMNAANGVASPRITPLGKSAEVVVRNNLFLNNVHCWQLAGLPTKSIVSRYIVEHNSFVLNYPYNPDKNTSNPGALEIGNNYTASSVEIRGNLFAHNSYGAIFAQWDDHRGPPVTLADNLFYQNGDPQDPAKGAVVGKFNGSAVHGSYSAQEIAEDFSWKVSGNVVLDPQLPLPELERGADGEAAEEEGSDVEIARSAEIDRFANRMKLELDKLPFPNKPQAKNFGAKP